MIYLTDSVSSIRTADRENSRSAYSHSMEVRESTESKETIHTLVEKKKLIKKYYFVMKKNDFGKNKKLSKNEKSKIFDLENFDVENVRC